MTEEFTGAEIVLKSLLDQGVEVVFGYPGGAALHIYDSIFKQKLKDKVFITHVSFKLNKHPEHNIEYGDIKDEIKTLGLTISTRNISQAVINIRERKLPNPNKIDTITVNKYIPIGLDTVAAWSC